MPALGAILMLGTAVAGLLAGEYLFYLLTGRLFWRAMVPVDLRHHLAPDDRFRMDPFHHLEEWTALLFFLAFLTLPLIALDTMGLLPVFH